MDAGRLKAILGHIERRDNGGVTETESSYCKSRGWVVSVTINDRAQLGLTSNGKAMLEKLRQLGEADLGYQV